MLQPHVLALLKIHVCLGLEYHQTERLWIFNVGYGLIEFKDSAPHIARVTAIHLCMELIDSRPSLKGLMHTITKYKGSFHLQFRILFPSSEKGIK